MAIRRLYCIACKPPPMDLEDSLNHWQCRTVALTAKKPADHSITVTDYEPGQSPKTKRTDLPNLLCDKCGSPIPDGVKAWAYTAWRGATEPEMWEHQYGEIV